MPSWKNVTRTLSSIRIFPKTLHFRQPATTSRGVYQVHDVCYLEVDTPEGVHAVGECAPLPDLTGGDITSAVRMGIESLQMQLDAGGSTALFDTAFSRGEQGIPINGLIWMGTYEVMRSRLEEKLRQGFHCIKLKIGAINFEDELSLIRRIRCDFSPEDIELRVDANGAFSPADAMEKLKRLSDFHLHSIEQPIRQGQWQEMARLCEKTPLPIALDEELIGIEDTETKSRLLSTIKPQYIILKPTLHGGFSGADEWIRLAEERSIPWWATSALESNVGLNAIAHWCARHQERIFGSDYVSQHGYPIPQGLGTGQLFTDNIPYPLIIEGEKLWYRQ